MQLLEPFHVCSCGYIILKGKVNVLGKLSTYQGIEEEEEEEEVKEKSEKRVHRMCVDDVPFRALSTTTPW